MQFFRSLASRRVPHTRRLQFLAQRFLLGAWLRPALLCLPLALALTIPLSSLAQSTTERTKQKQAAESERASLRQKLTTLKRDINQTETQKNRAADQLAKSEVAISDASRALRDLGTEQKATAARLRALEKQLATLQRQAEERQQQTADLLRAQYINGSEDRLKLLLSGDNPNRINRDLHYMGYLSQAQAQLIQALRRDQAAIEKNRQSEQNAKKELDEIANEQKQQKAKLEAEKKNRATLLAQLSDKLTTQQREVSTIERDAEQLSTLVNRLGKLIAEQRKAEKIAAERRRRIAVARAKAAEQRRQQQAAKERAASGPITPPAATPKSTAKPAPAPAPAPALARNEMIPDAGLHRGQSFSALKGKLRLPVAGDLTARYGSKRGNGSNWKGVFIRAGQGTEVRSVAGGQIVFSEWLRGFGNLLIIDHGGQYMTIYGNNQALLKQVGDAVNAGDVIANVGNSGGNEDSGLYFEMRHQGRTFDPLSWATIR